MKIDFLKIKAASPLKHSHPGFDAYVLSMEKLIREILPESAFKVHETSQFIPIDTCFEKLAPLLPLVELSEETEAPCTLSLTTLVREEHTHGVALFLCNMISQKLCPGKKMTISCLRSLSFKFIVRPKERFYVIEFFLEVDSKQELQRIQENFPRFKEEVRSTILGVRHARRIVGVKGLTLEEKRMLLHENLFSLIKDPSEIEGRDFFGDVQSLLFKGIYDQDPDKIPDHLFPIIDTKPQTFDPLIFREIEQLSALFHDEFATPRPTAHLSKLLSYLYLFKKVITYAFEAKPKERHLSFKMMQLHLDGVPTLAVLLGINLIETHESLEEKELFENIKKTIPNVTLVPGSHIINEQGKNRVRTLYIEVQKNDQKGFGIEEVKLLKKKLPKEIKKCIQKREKNRANEVKNEEQVRNVLRLTKELKSIHEPIKAIVQFHHETPSHFLFSVILARLQKPKAPTLFISSTPEMTIRNFERKVAGITKKRYTKEISLYEVLLPKKGHALAKARQKILSLLKATFHKVDDFDGGMICRKYENLAALKALLNNPLNDTLIENYFYGISPPFMQSLIDPHLLKGLFEMLLEEKSFSSKVTDEGALFSFSALHQKPLKEIEKKARAMDGEMGAVYLQRGKLYVLGLIVQNRGQIKNFFEKFDELSQLV
ncbi:hypothetical protein [Candidatus Neptunochlamydia vexilliferae]|nr:hypothetical protein [Candidatus Neptunochlamydia vexilliferae]